MNKLNPQSTQAIKSQTAGSFVIVKLDLLAK